MTRRLIDLDEVADVLRTIGAEMADEVNPVDSEGGCVYNGPNGTHCIAGETFKRLGLDTAILSEWEGKSVGAVLNETLFPDTEFGGGVALLLGVAQSKADDFLTWGDVILELAI